jgi:hypothetical protein
MINLPRPESHARAFYILLSAGSLNQLTKAGLLLTETH